MGDRFFNENLATTMEAIAEHGRAGFYEGWVADDILGSSIHLVVYTRKTILMQRWQIMLRQSRLISGL